MLALEEEGDRNKEEVGVGTEPHPPSVDVTSEETRELKVSHGDKRGSFEQKIIF